MQRYDERESYMKKRCMVVIAICACMFAGCGADNKTQEVANESETVAEKEQSTNEIEEVEDTSEEEEIVVPESEPEIDVAEEEESQTSEDFYYVATSETASTVEAYAAKIRKQILDKDWDALAMEISFPIELGGVTVEDSAAFLEMDIDNNLSQAFVDAFEAEDCHEMFCNYQGIMMGEQGQVWIASIYNEEEENYELRVIGINNMLE